MKRFNVKDLWKFMTQSELLYYDAKGPNKIVFQMTDCKQHTLTCTNMHDRDCIIESLKKYIGVYF